jgi:hypothetical protein
MSIIKPDVAEPFRGKTRKSASDVAARRLGQVEAYLTVRQVLFRVQPSRHGRDYRASAKVFAGFGRQHQV